MRIFELLEDKCNYYIVSELLDGGELYERVVSKKFFSEKDAANIINQTLLALSYMHSRNMIHRYLHLYIIYSYRDIKPENILLESADENQFNIKITDFGFACFFDPKEGLSDVLGSPLYMAPEIVQEKTYDLRVDVWSVGVIAYILLSGRPPFKGKTKTDIFKSILEDELNFSAGIWSKISSEAKDFISASLKKDFKQRAFTQDLLNHKWL